MRIKHLSLWLIAGVMIFSSCSTPKNVVYFQDVYTGTVIDPARQQSIKVTPEDKLSIVVTTQDPALSSLFNLVTTQNRMTGTTSATSTIGNTGTSSGQMSYYTVDHMGDINFPVLGKLHIAGMNRFEIAEFIERKLQESDLVKDPIVTVEFANTGISIIGEVSSPGRYEFNKDQLTIIDAIAMAGDLTLNGDRTNVLVMRYDDKNGRREGFRIDLTDLQTLAQSPVYYIQQDDVVYVEPNKKRIRETTPNGNSPFTPAFWITLGSAAITISTLVLTLTR